MPVCSIRLHHGKKLDHSSICRRPDIYATGRISADGDGVQLVWLVWCSHPLRTLRSGMSARTRGKRKTAAVPEEEVAAPSKPAKRARRGKQEPEKQNPPEPAAAPPGLPDLPDLPPPPIEPIPEILPAADANMEYPGKDEGPTTNHDSSLDQEPSHPEANEEPEDDPVQVVAQERVAPERAADLYLDTVNRAALDFDFEKVCSISLSNLNVYGCLVCGKYFQGRSKKSPAYAHSISDDHHVFINLESTQVSVLSHSRHLILTYYYVVGIRSPRWLSSLRPIARGHFPRARAEIYTSIRSRAIQASAVVRSDFESVYARLCRAQQYQSQRLPQRCPSTTFTRTTAS